MLTTGARVAFISHLLPSRSLDAVQRIEQARAQHIHSNIVRGRGQFNRITSASPRHATLPTWLAESFVDMSLFLTAVLQAGSSVSARGVVRRAGSGTEWPLHTS